MSDYSEFKSCEPKNKYEKLNETTIRRAEGSEMIENHVTNLELSNRLKELGVKQNSIFYWNHSKHFIMSDKIWTISDTIHSKENCSAFLSSELGEILPAVLKEYNFTTVKLHDVEKWWEANYRDWPINDSFSLYDEAAKTESDVRAKMLIYLIEKNIVTDEWKKEWLI